MDDGAAALKPKPGRERCVKSTWNIIKADWAQIKWRADWKIRRGFVCWVSWSWNKVLHEIICCGVWFRGSCNCLGSWGMFVWLGFNDVLRHQINNYSQTRKAFHELVSDYWALCSEEKGFESFVSGWRDTIRTFLPCRWSLKFKERLKTFMTKHDETKDDSWSASRYEY